MTKAHITKAVGSILSIFFAGAAVRYPQYAGELGGLSGVIMGWLHLPQPGSAQ